MPWAEANKEGMTTAESRDAGVIRYYLVRNPIAKARGLSRKPGFLAYAVGRAKRLAHRKFLTSELFRKQQPFRLQEQTKGKVSMTRPKIRTREEKLEYNRLFMIGLVQQRRV